MRESAAAPSARARPPDPPTPDGPDEFERLRALLIGPEQRHLAALDERLNETRRARELSHVLPEAIALRGKDPRLTRALTPSVEEAITSSVRRNPKPLADALFPVMGPAIRRAIAHALSTMVESLNRTVEQSVSWRALTWRWTAWRTGTPYAQVVLLNTLVYRVEQVFLIHAESGLLLQHVAADDAAVQDADTVSAMLTAIRDFVHDSFGAREGVALDEMQVGDLTVLVEPGPTAVVAAVVRGTPPPDLRASLQDAVETIHLQLGPELAGFSGDNTPFEPARPVLQECLRSQFRAGRGTRSWRRWAIAAAFLVALLGLWWGLRWRDQSRFEEYVRQLREQPGIVIVGEGRRGGRFYVGGLRDPQAADPVALLDGSGLVPERVDQRWEPYQSHHPGFVLERARAVLAAPATVTLALKEGTLVANGSAPGAWVADARRVAMLVPGVLAFDASGVVDETLAGIVRSIESTSLRFPKGSAELAAAERAALGALRSRLAALDSTAKAQRTRFRLQVIGHADADGTPEQNIALSAARAAALKGLLGLDALDGLDVSTRGVGSDQPLTPGENESQKQQNRRVSFRVGLGTAPGERQP